jgi:alpha-D-ribose 1-methylphosphonate 5-triphosphate synthase subunit PhnG
VSETLATDHRESRVSLRNDVTVEGESTPLSSDELYGALARADSDDLVSLADRILETPSTLTLVAGPTVVSSPLRLAMPGDEGTVVVGHVALTSCEVALDGIRGDGIRTGRSLEGSLAAAICDAEVHRAGRYAHDVLELARTTLRATRASEGQRADATLLTRIGEGE